MSDLAGVDAQGRLGLWIRAARPRTLSLSVAPILVGVAHAHAAFGRLAWTPVLAATLSALAIQIATNLANDAADGARGLDGPRRLGPQRMTGSGLMSADEVRRGAIVATLLAVGSGLVAVAFGGLPILLIGVASIIAAWAYSNGPRPISATPLGELFVVAYFGVAAVCGIEWLAAGRVSPIAVLLGVAIGLPAAAVLTVNNHRDRVEDARNGRRTLAILVGARGAIVLYAGELLGAVALAAAAIATPPAAAAIALLVVPAVVAARRLAALPIGRELNGRLGATAGFQLLLAAAIAVVYLGGLA
ncbi:MAG: 1,4-dihydroxy-2-naphthoate octaprenyltransferase [Hyphomicrobiales bacterium]|nr:1,4-dihydroxy-2-naphthoate octaprenyltransferase [Hyphomicrobiales bacterium]